MSFVSFYLLKTIWKIVLILASVSTDFNPKIWILASMNTVFDKFNLAALPYDSYILLASGFSASGGPKKYFDNPNT